MGQRDILILISDLLTELKIPYLLTGSFASSLHGFPRATHDIDFAIEINPSDFPKLKKSLKKLEKEFIIDFEFVKESINKRRQFEIYHAESSIKVDFWPMKKSEFNNERIKRARQEEIFGKKIWLISPEDLILTKLIFCKEIMNDKHIRDCIGIVQIQGNNLDRSYLSLWARKLKVENLLEEISGK